MSHNSIRLGFIGAGWWATSNHIPTAQKRKEVILDSVCRLGTDELKRIKEKFNFEFASENYKELLERDLDGVVISSPHGLHYEHSKQALQKNINVLIEKPMATKSSEAKELFDIANKKNLSILMSHGWNYLPESKFARKKLKEGVIGEIQNVVCNQSSGVRELLSGEQWNLKGSEIMFSPEPKTWSDPEIAQGGYGLAQMTHALALTFFITELNPLRAFSINNPNSKIELFKSIILECEKNISATFTGSSTHQNTYNNCEIKIYGTEGTIILIIGEKIKLEIFNKNKNKFTYKNEENIKNNIFEPTNNFIDILINPSSKNWSEGELGLKTTYVLDASYRSQKSIKFEDIDAE
tara:strand:- start:1606 stop:2661 length:1056 start_codon:yes stop_codon:yes gene_type:complete